MKTVTFTKREKIMRLTLVALLSALVVVLQLFFSSFRIGPVTLNFTLVPIVMAAAFVGPVGGLLVGLISGITTVVQVFTSGDPFYTMLITVNPAVTAIICLLKTSLAGYLSGVVYNALTKTKATDGLRFVLAGAVCPFVNTGIFCAGMLLFFRNGLYEMFGGTGSYVFYIVFVLLAGINFIAEFAVNIILSPAIGEPLTKLFKSSK